MKQVWDEMALLTLRIFANFDEFVASRKSDVASGVLPPEQASLQVENYGHGLAKTLNIAENLFEIPSSGMTSSVNRVVLEINPNDFEDHNKG